MSEQFSILIDSRTRFETSEPGGVWLSMPTTKEQLHEAMQRVGITADNPQDFFINGFANTEQQPFDVPLPVIQSAGLDELNYLGNLLAMQRDEDRDKFTAAVALGERAGSVKDLINLAQNLDCYWLYPTVQNEEDYGYYLIDELDELELPEEAKKYFMYEDYGRDAAINDGGRFTEQGYMPHIRFHDLRHTAATNMHQLTGDFYTVGEVLGHTLAGIGVSLGLSMNFEAVTARYVDVRLERKKEVLDAYHGAVKQSDPAKAEKAEPKKAKSAAKKKSSDLEL